MDAADKRMLEREALRNMIQQWNANRLDLFALSEPNENLEFHGVMRFYFQDSGQKIATKCIRVASDATVSDVIETLIEKFRPDMRMLSLGSYSLWETHGPDDERKLEPHEKPLLVQLNWHADDREGRFLLKCLTGNEIPSSASDKGDQNFKRKLSKREKKELKKKEKLSRMKSDTNDENRPVAEKLYTELPETSFMRSISNPEAVMRRRRQQKLGRKLQQFKSKDGGPDTGGTLRIYGGVLRPDVAYITLLLSVNDSAATVLRETLDKYGMGHHDPLQYCIVQEDKSDNTEYILEDDECPLALMNMTRSSIMFHVRRRPADAQPRRRKKKTAGQTGQGGRPGNDPLLVEVTPDAAPLENGRRLRITDPIEVGSGNGTALQLYGPSIQPRHCVVAPADGGGYTVTPLHPDAQVYVNGQRIAHTQRLQHGCLLKFGRVSTFRFVDPAQENIINRNLAQSQNYGSGSIYDRSGASPGESGAMSPTSEDNGNGEEYREYLDQDPRPYNNNTLKMDEESLTPHHLDNKDGSSIVGYEDHDRTPNSPYKDNYETTFDLDGNVETKSICSAKSGGSGHDNRMSMRSSVGQEAILPAVLEFPEAGQAQFLAAVITCLDPHAPAFKLAPVYTLYLCARYRASTHYRPELTPTERAQKLTNFLHHVAYLIHSTVQERCKHSAAQAFWMANASELLHFLKYDRHISSFSTQAQELLSQTVEAAFSNLVACFQAELSGALESLMSRTHGEASEATAATLRVLAGAVVLLRLCRVNAALTLQLFSSLFYYINSVCFNKLVTEPGLISPQWGAALTSRLALLSAWALRQGSEIAADCQLAKIYQAARLIQRTYRTGAEVVSALSSCSKLNSVQVRALLTPLAPPEVVEAGVAHAARLADELCRADGRGVRLEESGWLCVDLMIPCDGFSAEVVRGVPPGLCEFVGPLQRAGLCRLAAQPRARGDWAVYLARAPPAPAPPPVHIVQLHKNANGMGLSIVAAKGSGQSKLGIYIKSVVPGGAAAADGRLAAGDQLLSVDGQSLVGITQEKAAEYLVRTGPTVTLEVAKQGAMLHGLATLLHQPAYGQRQGSGGALRRASERDLPSRLAAEPVKPSKSTPALHHAPPPHLTQHNAADTHSVASESTDTSALWAQKSRSSHNLAAPQRDAFYQTMATIARDRWGSDYARRHSAHFSPDALQTQQNNQANVMSVRAAKLAEMSEEVTRREQHAYNMQHRQHNHIHGPIQAGPPPQQLHQHMQSPIQSPMQQPIQSPMQQMPQMQPMSPQMQHAMSQQMLAQQIQQQVPQMQQQMQHNMPSPSHLQHSVPQRYEWHQPPSPQRSQPPVAPKPQQMNRRSENETEEDYYQSQSQQPQPQTSHIEPDEDRYVASALEPPGVVLVTAGAAAGSGAPRHKPNAAHNPWQREEHERQAEARRQAARARRDAAISHLVSLGAARTPAQNQQLRALQLERDFELRATEQDQEERGTADGELEEDEHITSDPPAPTPAPAPAPAPAPNPPKSILKTNTNRSEITNGYAQEQGPGQPHSQHSAASDITSVESSMSELRVTSPVPAPAPPPPARGSSFAVMASRRPLSPLANTHHSQDRLAPQSPVSLGRDKRVSFHAVERSATTQVPPAPPSTSPPPLERDDPVSAARFIEETEALLASPTTPTTPTSPNAQVTHTPGVIGAQEVYKDPRTRRLAEQQAARASHSAALGAVPEQLSFKEKMKMFALESGEASTPKDKVKISRAQRDIDAVH